MAIHKMQIPVLVREMVGSDQSHFRLQPVFVPHPVVQNISLDGAEKETKEILANYFRNFQFSADRKLEWLWYNFCPQFQDTTFALSINYQNKHAHGKITAIIFELRSLVFVCLPTLRSYVFIAGFKGDISKYSIGAKIPAAVQRALKIIEEEGFSVDLSEVFQQGREHISKINIRVNLNLQVPQSQEDENFLDFFGNDEDSEFDGFTELYRCAKELSADYPSNLSRAYHQEPLVSGLYPFLQTDRPGALALIGSRGVGRHTILNECVFRYYRQSEKEEYRPRRFWLLDPGRVIAGMSLLGAWQKRFAAILDAISKEEHDDEQPDILIIDNPVALIRAGQSRNSKLNLADLLLPYLETKKVPLIIIASKEEWQILEERNPNFAANFMLQQIKSTSNEEALRMLISRRREMEDKYNVDFSIYGLQTLYQLSRQLNNTKSLPGALLDVAERIARRFRGQRIEQQEVMEEFSQVTGLRIDWLDRMKTLDPDQLEKSLQRQLVGQVNAVKALAGTVKLLKARLQNPNRPVATLLFAGPTGTGKTHASRLLCRQLTGSEKALVRFDMNEYNSPDAVSRLIGNYHRPEGELIEKLRRHPFTVLLFDEIEKAHPLVINLLLQVLDEGRLSDSLGRTVIFTNSIIIMTSNAGADRVSQTIPGFGSQSQNTPVYIKVVEETFPPEFVNRIDDIIVFEEPSFADISRIAQLQIDQWLRRDGFLRRTTVVILSKDALDWVAQRGYQPKLGGRALVRQIEKDLTTLTASQLVTLQSDQPVILEIDLENDRLRPKITPLLLQKHRRPNWIPKPTRNFYRHTLNLIKRLDAELREYQPDTQFFDQEMQKQKWQYFDALERLESLKQEFGIRLLNPRDEREFAAPLLRIKAMHSDASKDILTEENLHSMRNVFRNELPLFDRQKALLVADYTRMAMAYYHCQCLLDYNHDSIEIQFEAMVNGLGMAELSRLEDLYIRNLRELGMGVEKLGRNNWLIEGFGLTDLLESQVGIHLFTQTGFHPIPIRLQIKGEPEHFKIVRLYDDDKIIYDCKTGLLGDILLHHEEFSFLLFGGLKPEHIQKINTAL